MKTNKLWSIMLMLVMAIGMTVSFSSCGGSDDDNSSSSSSSPIVGTWKQTFSTGYVIITINANGTGTLREYDHGKWDDAEKFHYVYSNNVLTVIFDENGEKNTSYVEWLGKDVFIIKGEKGDETYIRQ